MFGPNEGDGHAQEILNNKRKDLERVATSFLHLYYNTLT